MKITFNQCRELEGGRIVNPGDTLESPKDGSDELFQAYVDNGIATVTAGAAKPVSTDKEAAANGI